MNDRNAKPGVIWLIVKETVVEEPGKRPTLAYLLPAEHDQPFATFDECAREMTRRELPLGWVAKSFTLPGGR